MTPTRLQAHNLDILQEPLSPPLISAETKEKEGMAFKHADLPIWGVQFHPEAVLTQFGLELLANWIKVLQKA